MLTLILASNVSLKLQLQNKLHKASWSAMKMSGDTAFIDRGCGIK